MNGRVWSQSNKSSEVTPLAAHPVDLPPPSRHAIIIICPGQDRPGGVTTPPVSLSWRESEPNTQHRQSAPSLPQTCSPIRPQLWVIAFWERWNQIYHVVILSLPTGGMEYLGVRWWWSCYEAGLALNWEHFIWILFVVLFQFDTDMPRHQASSSAKRKTRRLRCVISARKWAQTGILTIIVCLDTCEYIHLVWRELYLVLTGGGRWSGHTSVMCTQ